MDELRLLLCWQLHWHTHLVTFVRTLFPGLSPSSSSSSSSTPSGQMPLIGAGEGASERASERPSKRVRDLSDCRLLLHFSLAHSECVTCAGRTGGERCASGAPASRVAKYASALCAARKEVQ